MQHKDKYLAKRLHQSWS